MEMNSSSLKKTARMDKNNIGQKFLRFALTRIILGIIVCVSITSIAQIGIKILLELTSINEEFKNLIGGSTATLLFIIVYATFYSLYERRKISELSGSNLAKNLITGILLGTVLQTLTVLVIYLNNGFSVISLNSFIHVLPSLTMAFTAAIPEELLFRGIIFRIVEEKLGSYLALAISAIIFASIHFLNPNSTLIITFGIAIQGGLLLGAAYIYSKNLWFPIAIHFAWNIVQSGVFGAATSGNIFGKSLLTTKIEGTELITGGQFGPEGSIQATLFCLAATIILMILNHRQKKIIIPYWRNKN